MGGRDIGTELAVGGTTSWPWCGRREEEQLINAVVGGSTGGTAVVLGAAGIGKTRLLRELAAALEASGRTVRWVVGGPLTRDVPLGALAEYLPAETAGAEPAALIGHARRQLSLTDGDAPPVVFVDDTHQLDELSAAAVHQLCLSSTAAVVCAARSHVAAPMLTALCRDERTLVVELQPLGLDDVEAVLDAVLGGNVHPATHRAFYERSAGVALFLRELVEDALRSSALRRDSDGWVVAPGWAPSGRLVELVHARLNRPDEGERLALDIVATGEPVGLGLLLSIAPEDAVVRLERERLVEVRRDGRRAYVAFAHPLYRDAVRAGLGSLAERAHRLRLADEVERRGRRRRGDLLAVATWRLDGGELAPDDWRLAAQRALALRHDAAVALAQRAVEADAGAMSWAVLGEAKTTARDLDGAMAAFAAGKQAAKTDEEVAAIAIGRGLAAFWLSHEVEPVLAELEAAERSVSDAASRSRIGLQRVSVLVNSGRTNEGVALGEELIAGGALPKQERRRVQGVVANGLAFLGSTVKARAMGEALMSEASAGDDDSPFLMAVGAANVIVADLLGGNLAAADALLTEAHPLIRNPETAGFLAALHGRIALFQGKPRTALARFTEGRDGLAAGVSPWRSTWCEALRSETSALIGLPSEPVAPLSGPTGELAHRFLAMDTVRAEAVRLATRGDLPDAAVLLEEATAMATSCELWAAAVVAHYEAFRYGVAGADRALLTIASRVDGEWGRTLAAHAAAHVAGDASALETAAQDLYAQGAVLFAAECAADAARVHDRHGQRASARRATALAHEWHARCEGCWSPKLAAFDTSTPLTKREREIALMAAAGLSNREIAARASVGIRTVEGHLLRIYGKLGVSNRGELGQLFVGGVAQDRD